MVEDQSQENISMIGSLMDLGLTEYEAKIYISLVTRSPLAVTDISREAEIPMSKIYGVLSRLETGGWINVVPERPKKFGATDPRVVIDLACRDAVDRLEQSRDILLIRLGALFDKQSEETNDPEFLVIHGNTNIIKRFKEVVASHPDGVMIHLAFASLKMAERVISLVKDMPGEPQIFIIIDHSSLSTFTNLLERYPGVRMIEAPEDHPDETILFVYAEESGMYCSIKNDEFVMALSIFDRGFLGMIRKFGEIAHPQMIAGMSDVPDIHTRMVNAHKNVFAGTVGKLKRHRKH